MSGTWDVSDEAARIIDDAKAKLDALARVYNGDNTSIELPRKYCSKRVAGMLALSNLDHNQEERAYIDNKKAANDIEGHKGDNDKGAA